MGKRATGQHLQRRIGLILAALLITALAGLQHPTTATPVAVAAERPTLVGPLSAPRPKNSDQSDCETTVAKARSNNVTDDITKLCKGLVSLSNALKLDSTQLSSMSSCAKDFITNTANANPEVGAAVNRCGTQSCVDYIRPKIIANGDPPRSGLPSPAGVDPTTSRAASTADVAALCSQVITSVMSKQPDKTGNVIACLGRGFDIDKYGNTDVQTMVTRCQNNPDLKDPTDRTCSNGILPDALRALLDGTAPATCPAGGGSGTCTQWNVAGTWTLALGPSSNAGPPSRPTLQLTQTGTSITGTVAADPDAPAGKSKAGTQINGTISGSAITLNLPWYPMVPYSSSDSLQPFTGTVSASQIQGGDSFYGWTMYGGQAICSTASSGGPSSGGTTSTSTSSTSSGATTGTGSSTNTGGSSSGGNSTTSSSSSAGSGGDSGCIDLFGFQICISP